MNARTLPEYLEPLTPLALRYAEESACKELGLYSAWLESASTKRQMSDYFGEISVEELVAVSLNELAPDAQIAAAMRELRKRFLADEHEYVLTLARRAMLP